MAQRTRLASWTVWMLGCNAPAWAEPKGEPPAPAPVPAMLNELATPLALAPNERADLQPALTRFVELGGHLAHARNTVWVATVHGCRGACLAAVALALADGAEAGLPDAEAADLALLSMSRAQPSDPERWARSIGEEVSFALASQSRPLRCASARR
jgi:hypothetical protein